MENNDLISRSALIAKYDREHEGAPGMARRLIEEAEAVDAVEVVRCRDCKIWCNGWCRLNATIMGENHFCSYGKRREDERPVEDIGDEICEDCMIRYSGACENDNAK